MVLDINNWDKGPDGTLGTGKWMNTFGNQSFAPDAVTRSTGYTDRSIASPQVFYDKMNSLARDKNTKVVTIEGVEIADGLSVLANRPWFNAAGNDAWTQGDPTPPDLMPNAINVGATAVPPQKGKMLKSGQPRGFVDYTSRAWPDISADLGSVLWKGDGTPVYEQWLAPDFDQRALSLFYQMAGVKGTPNHLGEYDVPTDQQWADALRANPKLPKREVIVNSATDFCRAFKKHQGCDDKGRMPHIDGTSFIAPYMGGVHRNVLDKVRDPSLPESMATYFTAGELMLWQQYLNGDQKKDVLWVSDPKTGTSFAPFGGHGDVPIDAKGIENLNGLFKKMQDRRKELTAKGEVWADAGVGDTRRRVLINGQPDFRVNTVRKVKNAPTKEMDARAEAYKTDVTGAFKACEKASGLKLKNDDPIYQAVQRMEYQEAFDLLKVAVDASPKAKSGATTKALANATTVAANAEKHREYRYTFEIPPGGDQIVMNARVSLEWAGKGKAPSVIGIRPPNWKETVPFPITGPSTHDTVTGSVGGTSGVFPAKSQGTWELVVTGRPINPKNITIFVNGERRDKENPSVVETVLLPIRDKAIAARHAALPGDNHLKTEEPHEMLRRLQDTFTVAAAIKELPEEHHKSRPVPTRPEEMNGLVEKLIKETQLYKDGHIKDIKIENPEKGTIKTSMLPDAGEWDTIKSALFGKIQEMHATARDLPGGRVYTMEGLQQNWTKMALAAAMGDISIGGDTPASPEKKQRGGEPWHQKLDFVREINRDAQKRKSRESDWRKT